MEVEPTSGAERALVAFGGYAGRLGMPVFEFRRMLAPYTVHKLFVRDLTQSWYQKGLPSADAGLEAMAHVLAETLDGLGARRRVFVGNSMEGYAALLFGALLGADAAIAFAPQTFIDPWNRLRYADRRWSANIRRGRRHPAADPQHFDLAQALPRLAQPGTAFHVYYDSHHRLDRIHALRLADVQGVTLHRVEDAGETAGHNIVKALRDSGRLDALLQQVLSEPSARLCTL